jgi:hypothetical protein
MKDYTIAQWIDLARGLAPEGEARGMREHLASGCESCRELATFCESLSKVCSGIASRVLPESASRCARAIFPVNAARSSRRGFRIPIELIYDSFLSPAPVGLRASWEMGFQALYHAGAYSLDFRVEPGPPAGRPMIIGQIANREAPGAKMAGVPVSLKAGRSIIAQTHSNQFGEFQMEYDERKGLRLRVELVNPDSGKIEFESPRHIEVPLRRLVSAAGERSSVN